MISAASAMHLSQVIPGARALEMLLLTNVRTHDIRGMKWEHIDTARAEWLIPKFSKIGKPVTVKV